MRRAEDSRGRREGQPIAAVSFDVTHTLISSPRLGEIYSEVLGRHGVAAPPQELQRLVPKVWQELSISAAARRDRFADHPGGERGWWHRFLERLAEHLGTPPPSRFASAELFDRFAKASAWEVYPDVFPTLKALGATMRLGVVSNYDHRLPRLLESLGLSRYFDAVVYSAACGVEKPHPRIFERCLEELGVDAERALHVGDRQLEDVEGAEALGMRAVRIDRSDPEADLRALLAPILAPAAESAGTEGGTLAEGGRA